MKIMVGRIKFYNVEKGFGFINTDDGGEIFVHVSGLESDYKNPNKGDTVEYSVIAGKRGDTAVKVKKL